MSNIKQSGFLWISAIVLLLSACTPVYFENPVPQNARTMTTFPQEYVGTYVSEDPEYDDIVINSESYTCGEIHGVLGENAVLKPYKEFWVMNQFTDENQLNKYLVFLAKFDVSEGILEVFYLNLAEDLDRQQKLKNMTDVSEVFAEDGTLESVQINPSDAEFKAIMESDLFLPYGTYTKQ